MKPNKAANKSVNKKLLQNLHRIKVGSILSIRGPVGTLFIGQWFTATVLDIEQDGTIIASTCLYPHLGKNKQSIIIINPMCASGCAHIHGAHWIVGYINGEKLS